MEFLSIANLTKTYPGQKKNAVQNVSFTVQEGEIIAIVGENGSGKTTLLKLINGLEDADNGEVVFNGERIKGPSFNLVPGHPDIKMLFQEFNLFPKHSVKENINYHLRMLSIEEQEARVNFLLQLCRLEGMENKVPAELSGGQQQRVALAKAIADDPLLLLMDEPFSNLDLFLKDEIKRKVIGQIKASGNTALFITHDVKDALSLADKIAVLKEGKLLQFDVPKVIYEKPSDEYVAYLFGQSNILPASTFAKLFQLTSHRKFQSIDKSAKISIRPEHLKLTQKEKSQTSGKITHLFYLGDSFEADIKLPKMEVRVNTRKKNLSIGETVYLKVNASNVHILKK